jgi:hypothetical protein
MRTKALVLGGLPVPSVGPWVSLDSGRWNCRVKGNPFLQDRVKLDLELYGGEVVSYGLPLLVQLRGNRTRFVILESLDLDSITVYIEEVANEPNSNPDDCTTPI